MKKRFSLPAACLLLPWLAVAAAERSPWDRGQPELSQQVTLPVSYPDIFTREREVFGYQPRFLPGMLTFDCRNRPVMRVGLPDSIRPGENRQSVSSRRPGRINLIQYLDDDGVWRVTDGHVRAVREFLELRDGDELSIEHGERTPDAVEFDAENAAYTLVSAIWKQPDGKDGRGTFLVYSPDFFQTFQVLKLDSLTARLEPFRPHADRSRPPVITAMQRVNGQNQYVLIRGVKNRDGRIELSAPLLYAPAELKPTAQVGAMAGVGAQVITGGGKSFLVFMSGLPAEGHPGTPQYIVEYDHATGKMSEPRLLGSTGHRIDGHNVPVIDLDSRGILHVVGGAHWHTLKHWRSRQPYSIDGGWEEPLPVGGPVPNNRWSRDGLSYPGFLIGPDDTLHLVVRGRNEAIRRTDKGDIYDAGYAYEELNYALVYLRKKADGGWENRYDLVIPRWNHYSNYYHKAALDRRGRPFCVYYYYASWLDKVPGTTEKYLAKWPEDAAPDGTLPARNIRAHDPVLIGSFDGGDRWRVVTTPELLSGVEKMQPEH